MISTEKILAVMLIVMSIATCIFAGAFYMERKKDVEHQDYLYMKSRLYAVFGQEFDDDDYREELAYHNITVIN